MSIRATILNLIFGAVALVGAAAAQAQDYPNRPIRLLLPYNPGGIVDYVGRLIGQGLSQVTGQSVVPENKPGAGGILGTHTVATSDPDGYTVLLMDPAIVVNSVLQADINYDLFKDLKVVSVVSSSPLVLVTAPSLPVTSFKEFIDYAKANPGKLNYASAGVGTTPHLAGELLRMRTGIEATHVPYRGIAGSFADLMTGKVQFSFSSIPGAKPFTDDNRLRALATTGARRSPAYPDLPTVSEAGLPGFQVDLWLAVFVPSATPETVVNRLSDELKQTLDDRATQAALAKFGVETRGTSPAQSAGFVRAEYEMWKNVIEAAHLKQQLH
jgi:tripartite-type tricarboxylate transporter receptor subunit TctC